jgi:lysophospholipase L1-like esterase
VICEFAARFILPPTKDIQVSYTPRKSSTESTKQTKEDRGGIDAVLDWSGQNGIRLYPNVSALIHNHSLSKQDVLLETNNLGLRHPDLLAKTSDDFRILAMGDSITIADYVAANQTIPSFLQDKLNPINHKISVINAGLPGANTKDEFHHYLELADEVKPDIVLVQMYLNDAQNSESFYASKLKFPFSYSRLLSFIAERLQILKIQTSAQNQELDPNWRESFANGRKLSSGDMLTSKDGFDYEIYNAHKDFGLAWNPQSWKNLEEITDTFARATKERGSKFMIYLLPIHAQVYGDKNVISIEPQNQFKQMCNKLNLKCFDMLPVLQDAGKSIPMNQMYYDHCHYQAVGNRIIADALSSWIQKELS